VIRAGGLSRREALGWMVRAAVGLGGAGCARVVGDRLRQGGWQAAEAAIPPGAYRTQIWQPPGQTTAPIFVAVLVKPSVAAARIHEPYSVEDYGEVSPAKVIDELRTRYPGLLPNGLEVEPLVPAGETIGWVLRTRNIDVHVDRERSPGHFSIRLGGGGKEPLKPYGR
jgi:hypothetical protein